MRIHIFQSSSFHLLLVHARNHIIISLAFSMFHSGKNFETNYASTILTHFIDKNHEYQAVNGLRQTRIIFSFFLISSTVKHYMTKNSKESKRRKKKYFFIISGKMKRSSILLKTMTQNAPSSKLSNE